MKAKMIDLRCCGNCEYRDSWQLSLEDYFRETCSYHRNNTMMSAKYCTHWKWDQATNKDRMK